MEFHYQIRTTKGDTEKGIVEANSKESAIETLQRSGFIIIDIKESTEVSIFSRNLTWKKKISKKDLVIFSRQISTLFEAKVPLIESLRTMVEQTANPTFKEVLLDVTRRVDAGASLSKALTPHKKVFSDFYINMIHSGESSGKLQEVFDYLAKGLEREYDLTHKIKGALTYPAFIIFAFLLVMFVMMAWVVPNLTSILKETGQEMPKLTRIIIFISDSFAAHWFLIMVGVAIFFIGVVYYFRTPQGKKFLDIISLKIPIFGPMLQKFYLARFADSLSVLIRGGLPIVQALEITASVIGSSVYEGILKDTIEEVKKGNTISSVLKTRKEIPVMVSQMTYVGEESGKLDATLKSVSKFYQKEVGVVMDNIITLIEPFLILMLGLGVGVLLVAILMPMYNLAEGG